MALARVVTFDGVTKERMEKLKGDMSGGEQPEGLDSTELILLHDPETERSLAIVFFDSEEAYRRGDEVLDAMPAGDTPGRRASVARYDVAVRMTT